MSFFPPCPISKLVRHTFQKSWPLFTWLRDKKLNSSIQLLLNLHKYFFSSPEHHLTLLLPFLPLTVDSTSRVYYLRRNLQRNWVVGYQVEVTNGFEYCEFCVLCRLCEVMHWVMRFIQDLATVQPWNKILM